MVIVLEILSNMVRSNKVIDNLFFYFENAKSYKARRGKSQAHLQAFSYHVLTWIALCHSPVKILKRFNENRTLAEVETWNLNHGA